ncbi:MAG: heparin lyase I family protein [Paucibacter sp.]|nr:heparin lyase I family protein [Roseateles sp.]
MPRPGVLPVWALCVFVWLVLALPTPGWCIDDTVNQGEPAGLGAQAGSAVRSVAVADVRADIDASKPLKKQHWGVECNGVVRLIGEMPQPSVPANPGVDAAGMDRVGIAAPAMGGDVGIALRSAETDSLSSGAPRCELAMVDGARSFLPFARAFWFASRVWIEPWPGSHDEQIVLQWHDYDFDLALNPLMALIVQGDRAQLLVRWEAGSGATVDRTNIRMQILWDGESRQISGHWANLVIHARISPDLGDDAFLEFWIDGHKAASYRGPIGYRPRNPALNQLNYAKVGIYHWLVGNPWDPRYLLRSVYVRRSVLVQDPVDPYVLEQVSPLLR